MRDPEYKILMVDDDPEDVFAIGRGLAGISDNIQFVSVSGGTELFKWLRDPVNSLPSMIFMDINMPRMNGYEALQILKAEEAWRDMPVFVLSTSDHKADKAKCMQLGAAGFVTKFASTKSLEAWLSEIEILLRSSERKDLR